MLKQTKRPCTLSIDNVDIISDASNCKIAIDGFGRSCINNQCTDQCWTANCEQLFQLNIHHFVGLVEQLSPCFTHCLCDHSNLNPPPGWESEKPPDWGSQSAIDACSGSCSQSIKSPAFFPELENSSGGSLPPSGSNNYFLFFNSIGNSLTHHFKIVFASWKQ